MKYIQRKHVRAGFTLIEILVVIGIIGILATVVLVAVNPNRQFKQARDSQRIANVNTILNALGQNMADHQGVLQCGGGSVTIPDAVTRMSSQSSDFDIVECLVPDYLPKVPTDPISGQYTSDDDYTTGYDIVRDGDGRLTVSATGEIQAVIAVTR